MPDRLAQRRRIVADLTGGRREWFHLADVRNEVVGDQPAADGKAATRTTADVYIFEGIGGWGGVTADDFVRDVAGLDVDHINLHLNSPGGDAWEGVAIANVLRQHRADVTVWVDGIAASAASIIAMAGDEVVMSIGAQMMIHDASTITFGNAADLRKDIEMLESASNSIAGTYAAKAGGTAAEWRAVMQAESWYDGPEAVTAGLADRVATDADKGGASGEQVVPGGSDSFWDLWDSLSAADRHAGTVRALFAHAGRADAPAPRIPAGAGVRPQTPGAAPAAGSITTQEGSRTVAFTDEQLTTMRQQLGLSEDADEATIVAGLQEALAEQAEPPKPPTTASLPADVAMIDKSTLAELQANAARGVKADEELASQKRERLVTAALMDGRIRPADRDRWLGNLEKDPETYEPTLASLEKGLIPLAAIGHSGNDSNNDTDADALYASVFGKEG